MEDYLKNLDKKEQASIQYALGLSYFYGVPTEGVERAIDYKQAFYYFNQATKQGHADAMYMLGACYANGLGVDKDMDEALMLLEKAATLGCVDAKYLWGVKLLKGEDVPQDKEAAHNFLLDAADSDNIEAQYALGCAYGANEFGDSAENRVKSVLWLRKAADNGHVQACYSLAMYYKGFDTQYTDDAFWFFSKAADAGHAQAKYELAMCYYEGRGTTRDYEQAVDLFKQTCNENPKANFYLGLCYVNGFGVKKDAKQGASRMRSAIQQFERSDDHECAYLLGMCYLYGLGVDNNEKKAEKWLLKAAKGGFTKAQFELGKYYEFITKRQGPDTWKWEYNYMSDAARWYEEAARHGYAQAKMKLARLYLRAQGVRADEAKALSLFEQAAKDGCDEAMLRLGDYYRWRSNDPEREEKAAYWYKLAQEHGNATALRRQAESEEFDKLDEQQQRESVELMKKSAQKGEMKALCKMAEYYSKGIVVKKNINKAFEMWQQSALQGYAPAQYNLGLCYYNGDGVSKNKAVAGQWFHAAAQKGDEQAKLMIACYYDEYQAYAESVLEQWLDDAASVYDQDAMDQIAKYKKQSDGKLLDYILQLWHADAEDGDETMQVALAKLYSNGVGVEKNLEASFYWFKRAAEQKQPFAMYKVAQCYEDGKGIVADIREAVKWYKRAARTGQYQAQSHLSWLYFDGRQGLKMDIFESAKRFIYSHELFLFPSSYDYMKGIFCYYEVPPYIGQKEDAFWCFERFESSSDFSNYADDALMMYHVMQLEKQQEGKSYEEIKAIRAQIVALFKERAEKNIFALYEYGKALIHGDGVVQDFDEGERLLLIAAKKNLYLAQYKLGEFYMFARKDLAAAYKWLRRPAKRGHAESQYLLGRYYEELPEGEKDMKAAYFWYDKALYNGSRDARRRLEDLGAIPPGGLFW